MTVHSYVIIVHDLFLIQSDHCLCVVDKVGALQQCFKRKSHLQNQNCVSSSIKESTLDNMCIQ